MRTARLIPLIVAPLLGTAGPPARAEPAPDPAASQAAPAARPLLAAAQAKLAFDLIERLAGRGARTVTVSPASLASVLGLVAMGADAPIRAGLAKALGIPGPEALDAAREALRTAGGDAVHAADRLVFAPGSEPGRLVRAGLESLGVPHSVEDLASEGGVAAVNAWVRENTRGMIPEILAGPLDRPAFVALNALHFKARWRTPFDPQRTAPAPFTGADGKPGRVTMMHLPEGTHAFRQERGFVAVDLPFAGERFSLLVVTTTDRPARPEAFKAVAGWLSGTGFERRRGEVALPRFTVSGREDLLPALDAMGLKVGRASPTALAQFAPGAALSQVLQRAVIEVTEEGAEAAAATAAVTLRSLDPVDSVQMVVDKPFLYVLRDRTSGLVLIAGYVGEAPKEKA